MFVVVLFFGDLSGAPVTMAGPRGLTYIFYVGY
jgi:hypothetical protein